MWSGDIDGPFEASGGRVVAELWPCFNVWGMDAPSTVDREPESESFEAKSSFADCIEDWAQLVKTIVAMANTSGGTIVLERTSCAATDLDSARLDDKVNKYVGPRVGGITSTASTTGSWRIDVAASNARPHVFRCDLPVPGKSGKAFFYPGQIWVRHGSKNGPASPEDLERLVRERVARHLDDLRVRVLQTDGPIQLTDGVGVPVRFSNDPSAAAVFVDIDKTHPFTASTLGKALGKEQNWAAAAAECLDMKGKPEYWVGSKSARGGFAVQRYSQRAAEQIRAKVAADPGWNPLVERRNRGLRPPRKKEP